MRNKLNYISALLLILSGYFEAAASPENTQVSNKMNAVYWVLLIIFAGISITLFVLERRLNKLEKQKKEN